MITLALIGVGEWGKKYLQTAEFLDNVEIKYICAKSRKTLSTYSDKYVKVLSVNDLLKKHQIDGFIIATPETTHYTIAKKLLLLGYNVLIEKPLTTHYGQASELLRIWRNKKPKVVVGHIYLYNHAYQVVKKLSSRIKNIKSISFLALKSTPRKDISVVWDWGPHPISIMLDLIKKPVIEVKARGSQNTVNASIKFANNIEASFHISWLGTRKFRKLIVEGDNQKIEFDDLGNNQHKISVYKPNLPVEYPSYRSETPLACELKEFVETIKGNKEITSDIQLGVSVVKVLSAVEQSMKKGQSISII